MSVISFKFFKLRLAYGFPFSNCSDISYLHPSSHSLLPLCYWEVTLCTYVTARGQNLANELVELSAIWSMVPSCIVQVGLPCFSFKGAFVPPDKCEVIDQFIQFAVDRSVLSLCSQVNSRGLRGWVPPLTSPPSISGSSRALHYTYTHIGKTHNTQNEWLSLSVVPTPLIPATILISLEVLQGQASTVCVSGVSWCCQIKVLSSGGVGALFCFGVFSLCVCFCARVGVDCVSSGGDRGRSETGFSDLALFFKCCSTCLCVDFCIHVCSCTD